ELGEETWGSRAIASRSFARRLSGIPRSFRCSSVSADSASPSISLASNESAYWPKPPASSQARMFSLIDLRPSLQPTSGDLRRKSLQKDLEWSRHRPHDREAPERAAEPQTQHAARLQVCYADRGHGIQHPSIESATVEQVARAYTWSPEAVKGPNAWP